MPLRAQERRLDAPVDIAAPRLFAVAAEAPALAVGRAIGAAMGAAPSVAWAPRRGWSASSDGEEEWSFVGWGAAAHVTGSGEDRLAEVRDRGGRALERIERAGALPFAPRLFGGFAFDARRPRAGASELAAAWAPFGDAGFTLPRLLYGCAEGRAVVAAFVPEGELAAARGVIEGALRALERAERPSARPAGTPGSASEAAWIDLVKRATAAIGRRELDKVVLCRTRRVAFEGRADAAAAFAALDARHPETTRFYLAQGASSQGGAAFLGATPERLLLVRGRRAATEALAGSIPRRDAGADDAAAARLLASEKDRAEHAFVVRAIREDLAPLCEALVVPEAPVVRSLSFVHHLATPITAALRAHVHPLDLAARLHPTPALCGAPRGAAADFIRDHEPSPRGWYGGGAGWFDAAGDGAIHVAIRSALVAGSAAWIYAGAGIVAGSDPELELAETMAKERAMRDALAGARA